MSPAALVLVAQTQPAATPDAPAAGLFTGSSPLILVVLLGVLSIVPFVLLVGTSFVKISVVLGLVRNAIGTQQVPSNMVITGLAAILTLHIMAPTAAAVGDAAGPLFQRALSSDLARPDAAAALEQAWEASKTPVRRFLHDNATSRDRALFYDLARRARSRPGSGAGVSTGAGPATTGAAAATPSSALAPPSPDDLTVLLPAFVVSELSSAFAIGFLIFLPFLVVDLVVANLLTALGMQMLSPTSVSLPFKLLLFVLADGWYLIARALVLGYH